MMGAGEKYWVLSAASLLPGQVPPQCGLEPPTLHGRGKTQRGHRSPRDSTTARLLCQGLGRAPAAQGHGRRRPARRDVAAPLGCLDSREDPRQARGGSQAKGLSAALAALAAPPGLTLQSSPPGLAASAACSPLFYAGKASSPAPQRSTPRQGFPGAGGREWNASRLRRRGGGGNTDPAPPTLGTFPVAAPPTGLARGAVRRVAAEPGARTPRGGACVWGRGLRRDDRHRVLSCTM